MTTALLSPPPLADPAPGTGASSTGPSRGGTRAPGRPDAEDRWQRAAAPVGRFSAAMALVLLASAAIHALVVATALIANDTTPVPPHQEIAVEIVQEPPTAAKPAPPAAKTVAEAGLKAAAAEPKLDLRRSDPDRARAAPPPVPEPSPSKSSEQPPEPKNPVAQEPEPPKPPSATLDDDLRTLKSELAALKEEQEALKASASALKDGPSSDAPRAATLTSKSPPMPKPAPISKSPTMLKSMPAPVGPRQAASPKDLGIDDGGVGPIAGSADAVALPGTGSEADETVGYQALVFSQLAKAKGIGGRQGVPASAGVRFTIDDAGRLVTAAIISPSGEPALDAEALTIVRKAAPFPSPPEGAQHVFVANVNFTPMAAPSP